MSPSFTTTSPRPTFHSWQQWAIATNSPKNAEQGRLLLTGSTSAVPANRSCTWRREHAELAQYFRFVRRGAVRIGTTSNDADKKAVAFKNRNCMHVAIVQARRPGTISVVGLPAGAYGVRYATAAEPGCDLPGHQHRRRSAASRPTPREGCHRVSPEIATPGLRCSPGRSAVRG